MPRELGIEFLDQKLKKVEKSKTQGILLRLRKENIGFVKT